MTKYTKDDVLELLDGVRGIGPKTIDRVLDSFKDAEKLESFRQDIKRGQVKREITESKIYCGDNIRVMRKHLPDKSIDVTVTSPPYDNMRDYNGVYNFDYKSLSNELYRVTKPGGVVVWVVGDETSNFCESLSSFKQAIYFVETAGFNLLDTMVYKKKSYPPAYPSLQRYANQFEYMFVFSKGKPKTFNELRTDKKESSISPNKSKSAFRTQDGSLISRTIDTSKKTKALSNVWEFDVGFNKSSTDSFSHEHPATFPERLPRRHIKTWSNENDVVLDPMCGAGTTLKEAHKLGRMYIGIDIFEEYCELSKKRVESCR